MVSSERSRGKGANAELGRFAAKAAIPKHNMGEEKEPTAPKTSLSKPAAPKTPSTTSSPYAKVSTAPSGPAPPLQARGATADASVVAKAEQVGQVRVNGENSKTLGANRREHIAVSLEKTRGYSFKVAVRSSRR